MLCALVHRPGLLVRLWLGSARHPHVLRVRSGGCALSARNLPAPPTALNIDDGGAAISL
ncbi:DNA replication and repair protein RecF [Candidatus Pantoea varia]|uniref:DNA replication and repair protein RecF n=1 Tax=Candidatus Pantoea varia TaxID=1881036 RepID=A0A1I5HC72_9GAMM|nr:DNA replication and repair protein RecF [Pantoea varia]